MPKRHNLTVDLPIFDDVDVLSKKFTRGNRTAMTNELLEYAIKIWKNKKK